MKRRELLTGAGKVAAAALVAPLLPLGTIPLKPARLTTQYLVTFEGQVRELLVWDRPPRERSPPRPAERPGRPISSSLPWRFDASPLAAPENQ